MKIAINGSRSLYVEHLGHYLPDGVTEIISGAAKGIDNIEKRCWKQGASRLWEQSQSGADGVPVPLCGAAGNGCAGATGFFSAACKAL